MDLNIEIARDADVRLPHQVGRALIDLIRAGALPAGSRLPATRSLAEQLGVARLTVVEAYAWLADQGYIVSRKGSRSVVQEFSFPESDVAPVERTIEVTSTPRRPSIDFRAGRPDLSNFPRKQWAAALATAMRSLPADLLDYGDPLGYRPLRMAIAEYLHRSRGLKADPTRIAVTTGSAQSIDLLLRALPDYREMVIEHPGHINMEHLAAVHHVSFTRVPVDTAGLRTDLLPSTSGRRIAVVTPSHQFPTGYRLSLARRVQLIAWAEKTGALLVEDDYDSEFAYGGRLPLPLAKLDRSARVAYMGTFSKTMFPALRIGFLLVPESLTPQVVSIKRWSDWGGTVVQQQALTQWIEEGLFERHLQRMRKSYRRRHMLLIDNLQEHLGDRVRFLDAPVGMHLLAFFRTELSLETLIDRAVARDVRLHGLSPAAGLQLPGECGLILGFGNLSELQIETGAAAIADIVQSRA